MARLGVRWAWAGVLVLSGFTPIDYVNAQTPDDQLRTRLGTLGQWLAQSGVADAWRPLLGLEQLDRELAKGTGADRGAVAEVLGRLGSDDPGLAMERFVRVRQAIENWLTSLPPPPVDQLPAAARAAKPVFLPRTPVDLQDAKNDLIAALDRLDAQLKSAPPGQRDWRTFLRLDSVRQQLGRPEGPELTALDAAYLQFTSGEEGLGQVALLDVRNGLRQYLTTARVLGSAKLRKQYEVLLEALAVRLEKHLKSPSVETAEEIDQAMDWLEQAGQAKWLVRAISSQMSHPNLFARVSDDLIASRVAQPVDETGPVRDCILRTDIHATGHTVGDLSVQMVPSADQGQFDLVFQGKTDLDSVGYHGKVQVFANGTTQIAARKRVTLNPERFTGAPAQSQADANTTINGVATPRDGLLQRVACRRAEKQKPLAECIAGRHAEERFNEQLDLRADKLLAEANERYEQRFRRPLVQRRLFPELLRFSTSPEALDITAMQIGEGSLAAPGAPPQIGEGDLSVRVHQSAINNLTASALGGIILDERRMDRILTESLGAPKRTDEADPENWAITFARRQPVSVTFGDNTFTVTIRGRSYANQGNQYAGMNVTATYKIQRSAQGFKAVRQGDLVVVPPGFRLGSRPFSAPEQVLRTLLEHRFGKFLEREIVPKNLVLSPEGRTPLELQLSEWETSQGWLLMAWKQVPPTKSAAAESLPKPRGAT